MKNLLMIAYYYPPLGGIGALRPLHFSRYLDEYGWTSSVISVANDRRYLQDDSLLRMIPDDQVIIRAYRYPIFDIIRRFAKKQLRNYPLAYSFLDPMFDWVPGAIREGKKLLKKYKYDAIFATVPPYNALRVALALKKEFNLPVVVDMRDPFLINIVNWPSRFHKKFYSIYWRKLLTKIDRAIVLADFVKEFLIDDLNLHHLKPALIPNGYDPADFMNGISPPSDRFVLGYVGSFYGGMSPTPLFKSLKIAFEMDPSMRESTDIILMGNMNKHEILTSASKHGVRNNVQILGTQPHSEAVRLMQMCHLLLLFTGMVYKSASGKIFEYAASGRPVLSFGIQEFTKKFIEENQFGLSVNGNKPQEGAEELIKFYDIWKRGKLIEGTSPENYERYSRKKLTQQLVELLNEMTEKS